MARTSWTPKEHDLPLLAALDEALNDEALAIARRKQALKTAVDGGIPITQLATRLGVTPATIYRDIGRPVR